MKKGIFFTYGNLNKKNPDGIEKKILSQLSLFGELGINMELVPLKRQKGTYWNYKEDYSESDFVYFRKSTTIDFRFLHFFKKLKKANPNITVFMEIPTYPYEGEYGKGVKTRILLGIDKFFRRYIWKYIDRIIIVGSKTPSEIWKIKTIDVVNGIDVNSIAPILRNDKKTMITIGCIARFSPWHGYERLIIGLKRYFQDGGKRSINILMVGEGSETSYYKTLVESMHLEKQVLFTGKLTGDKLQDIYNIIDIGCCSLGRYKSGHDSIGDLKSREFLAKGLPMITGCKIDILKESEFDYFIRFTNDSSAIDIRKVIEFYENIKNTTSPLEMQQQIREYAIRYADIHNTFSAVLQETKRLLKI